MHMRPAHPHALLAVVAGLGLLAAGAALWLGTGGGPTPPPGPAAEVGPRGPADRGPPPVAAAPDPFASTADTDTTSPDPSGLGLEELRDEVAVDGAVAAQSPRVLVVRGAGAVPVAGAEVLFVTVPDATRRFGKELPRRRLEWPEHCGDRLTTGADGIVALPPTRHSWLAAARHGGDFAFAVVRPGRRTVTMALAPDERVTVEVTDPDGEPAPGVPVVLLQHTDGSRSARTLWHGLTGGDGRAVAPHFQLVRRSSPAGRTERFAAALGVAAAAPILAEFDGRPAPEAPIRLRLPALGRVEVVLTDHGDRPLLSPARIALGPVERAEEGFPSASRQTFRHREKRVGEEPVRFDWLAAGSRVRASARFDGERRPMYGEPLEVPRPADGPLAVRLPLSGTLGLIAGRLVLDSGEPLSDRVLTGVLWDGERTAGTVRIHTTADGRFDVVQQPREQSGLVLEVHAAVAPTAPGAAESGDGPARRRVGCRVPLRPPGAGERRELGDLVLGEMPLLCSGVVVDDRGEPVAGASVVVRHKREGRAGPPTFDLSALEARQRELLVSRMGARRGGGWRDVPLLRAVTDAAGRFELTGTFPGGELQLRADSDDHLAEDVPWLGVGQRFLVTIARNGVLRGRALLPPTLPRECASLSLEPVEADGDRGRPVTVRLSRQRGGRFVVEPLRAGRYDAVVRLRNVPEPVLRIPDVFVTPGECADPRLRLIDLRGSVFHYKLRAVDYGGNPMDIDSALVMRSKRADGKVETSAFRWRNGRVEFFAGSSLVDLVSFAPGCEPLEIRVNPGEQDVAMKRLVPAQLLLPGARELVGPDRKIRVSVILTGDSGYPQWLSGRDQRSGRSFSFQRWELGKSTGAWLEDSDLVDVPIVKSGKYQVILRVHATMSTRSQQVSVTLGEFELKVDGSKLTPVTVPIDADRLQAALQRLKPREQRPGRPAPGGPPGRPR